MIALCQGLMARALAEDKLERFHSVRPVTGMSIAGWLGIDEAIRAYGGTPITPQLLRYRLLFADAHNRLVTP